MCENLWKICEKCEHVEMLKNSCKNKDVKDDLVFYYLFTSKFENLKTKTTENNIWAPRTAGYIIHALLIIIWNKSKTVLTATFDLGLLVSFFVSLPLQSQSVPFPECHFTEFLSFCYYFDFCVTHFSFPHSISPIIFVTSLFIKWFMFFLPTPVWKHTYWDLNGLVE